MENLDNPEEQKPVKIPFSIFGEPVIRTRCQRDCMISAISGGMFSGLIAFLFTSNVTSARHVAAYSFLLIGTVYATYCAYDEYQEREQIRMINKIRYDLQHPKNAEAETGSNNI